MRVSDARSYSKSYSRRCTSMFSLICFLIWSMVILDQRGKGGGVGFRLCATSLSLIPFFISFRGYLPNGVHIHRVRVTRLWSESTTTLNGPYLCLVHALFLAPITLCLVCADQCSYLASPSCFIAPVFRVVVMPLFRLPCLRIEYETPRLYRKTPRLASCSLLQLLSSVGPSNQIPFSPLNQTRERADYVGNHLV